MGIPSSLFLIEEWWGGEAFTPLSIWELMLFLMQSMPDKHRKARKFIAKATSLTLTPMAVLSVIKGTCILEILHCSIDAYYSNRTGSSITAVTPRL